jgi:hypothetical protein
MNEHEISSTGDAAFFLANEVVNEHHDGFPVVQRADFGINSMFIKLNEQWFRFEASAVVTDAALTDDLERLAG